MVDKPPPLPIFDVVKKQDWIDKFIDNPELKQLVSTYSANPVFAPAYDYVQRARRAHKGHEPDRQTMAEALTLAEEIRSEHPCITKTKLAEQIQPNLPKQKSGKRYEVETIMDWLSGQKPKK